MPPQAAVLAGAIVWNIQRGRAGKVTLSQFSRRHKVAFVVGWGVLTGWLVPHILEGGAS